MQTFVIRPDSRSPFILETGDELVGEDITVKAVGSLTGRFLFTEIPPVILVRGSNVLIKDVTIRESPVAIELRNKL